MRQSTDWDTHLGNLAAELTVAAYPIALRHGMAGSWLDLEIDLWMVLAKGLKKWGGQSRTAPAGRADLGQANLIAELTDAAYRTTLKYGVQGSFLDLELSLYHAFHSALDDIKPGTDVRTPELYEQAGPCWSC